MLDLAGLSCEFSGKAYRMVESQEKVATMALVDTLDEQAILESLIEQTKPAINDRKKRHYLIETPFRYPPLKHGSRFGSRYEPSIFYAGRTLKSAICESAFYSFYFMSRSTVPYKEAIINHKTSFTVEVQDQNHIELNQVSISDVKEQLTHKTDYQFTQLVGKQLRKEGVSSFTFESARCHKQLNLGVLDIDAIEGEPKNYERWEVKQTQNDILFYCPMSPNLSESFNLESFLVDGVLPKPSN